MFNFGANIRDLLGEEISDDDTSADEYFSSVESDDEDDFDIFDLGGYDCDDSSSSFSDSEDELNPVNEDDEDDEGFVFNFGDTITKALVLWAVKFGISHTALSALLMILRRFGHFELPKLARTLLRTPRKAVKPRPCPPGLFFYRGIQYYMDQYNDEFLKDSDTVNIDFFIDGLSLSNSSKFKMWPILGSFVDQPTVRPFVSGCFAGNGDPKDPNDFMTEFVEELKYLKENGIWVTKDRIQKKFKFRCFVGDAPACAFAAGTMSHSSYFGCPKCDQVCCNADHKMYYQFFVGELRTDESFRDRKDIQHHKPEFRERSSLLLEKVMGMVSQFIIDAMHGIDLGVTKRVVKAIFGNETVCSKLSKAALSTLKSRFKSFRAYVPTDFARIPRTVDEFSGFKATEFRQLLLYTLPVLLKGVVSPALYSQVMKLHVAVRLLSDPEKFKDNITAAKELIKEFVDRYDDTIGKKHFTFYTHCLLHIADCVEKYGCLYSWSAYRYENHMRIIKRLLRRKYGHIQQFFNRIEELRYAHELEASEENRNKSKFNEFNLKANSLRDGCCMVDQGYPLVITNSFNRSGLEYIRGFRYLECSDFYDDPFPSMENMGTLLASNLSTTEEEFLVSSVIYKFFRLPFEDKFTDMERLVKNKWVIPNCSKNSAILTNSHDVPKSSGLQQSLVFSNQPKINATPVLNSKDPQKQINEQDIRYKISTKSITVHDPKIDHKFAIPYGVPGVSTSNFKNQKALTIINPISSVCTGDRKSSSKIEDTQKSRLHPTIIKKKLRIFSENGPQLKKSIQPAESVSRSGRFGPKSVSSAGVPNKVKLSSPAISNGGYSGIISQRIKCSGPLVQATANDINVRNNLKLGKNDVVPLPSSWKLLKAKPNVQSTIQSNDLSNGNGTASPFQPQIKTTKNAETSTFSNEAFTDLSKSSLKPLKSRPWSWFFENSNENPVSPSSATELIPKNVMTNKNTIKVPNNWKLVPAPISVMEKLSSRMKNVLQPIHATRTSSSNADNCANGDSSIPKISKPGPARQATENKENSLSSESPLYTADDEHDQYGQSEQLEVQKEQAEPQPHAKKRKTFAEEDDKFQTILEKLDKISKKESRNSANIKAIVNKLLEEEPSEVFNFPLRSELENDKIEACLSKPRFTRKLVNFLEKRTVRSTQDTIVSDLVEAIYHPKLLSLFTINGYHNKLEFRKLRMNEIILSLSKMRPKEYYNDLTKVINKMHQRFSRHHHEY